MLTLVKVKRINYSPVVCGIAIDLGKKTIKFYWKKYDVNRDVLSSKIYWR